MYSHNALRVEDLHRLEFTMNYVCHGFRCVLSHSSVGRLDMIDKSEKYYSMLLM